LDYYRDRAPRELQRKVFERQLELAAESRLPVVIHNRQAIDHVLEQLLAWQNQLTQQGSPLANLPGVLHSYEGSLTNADQAIAGRFSIGISGPVTFRNAPDRQQLVKELPLDRILLETDAPFLAPHPHRGRRNEPAYVRLIAQKVAELHAVDLEAVAQESTRRASQLFNWGAPV
jgi:TatD DNase family protein